MADNKPKVVKKAAKAQETPAGHNLTAETAPIPENTGEKRKPIPPVEHQFKPGNPGRPKGARNKLGEAFLEAMLADFTEYGVSVIEKVRLEKPDVYLKTVASILPQQVNVKVEPFEDMTDDQLRKHAERLLAELGPIAAFASGGGVVSTGPAPTGKPLN